MTPDAPAIAKLAAEMRARAEAAVVGKPWYVGPTAQDVLTILDALDAADARMKELGDAATERFDKLNARIAELVSGAAEKDAEIARLNGNVDSCETALRYWEHETKKARDRATAAEARAAKLRETVERLCVVLEPFAGYAKRAELSGMDDDSLRTVRVHELRRAAAERTRAVAEAEEGRDDAP